MRSRNNAFNDRMLKEKFEKDYVSVKENVEHEVKLRMKFEDKVFLII